MAAIQPRISVEYTNDATIIAFTDERILEDIDVRALREAVESVVEQAPRIHLVLDFRHVKFLSSAVLGLLIRISKRVYEQEGELRLCNIHPGIYEVFKITRLTNVFEIYEDVEQCDAEFLLAAVSRRTGGRSDAARVDPGGRCRPGPRKRRGRRVHVDEKVWHYGG